MKATKRKHTKSASSGTFTAVDLVIVLAIVITLVGTVFGWVYESVRNEGGDGIGYTYAVTFRVETTHAEVLEGLACGDSLYLVSEDCFLGYLRDDLAVRELTATDPTAPRTHVTATGSMVCVGNAEGRSLRVNGCDRILTPGDTVRVRTERETLTVRILTVTEVSS